MTIRHYVQPKRYSRSTVREKKKGATPRLQDFSFRSCSWTKTDCWKNHFAGWDLNARSTWVGERCDVNSTGGKRVPVHAPPKHCVNEFGKHFTSFNLMFSYNLHARKYTWLCLLDMLAYWLVNVANMCFSLPKYFSYLKEKWLSLLKDESQI